MKSYTVRAGDSLSSIAAAELGQARRWPELFAYNTGRAGRTRHPLVDPDLLRVGQVLFIPTARRIARHPAQRTRPVIQAATAPARLASAAAGVPSLHLPPTPATAPGAARTHVNSPAFKYDLDLMPPIKGEEPGFDYEITFKGQLYVWMDEQVELLTFTKSGFEVEAQRETDLAVGKLVGTQTVTFEPSSRKIGYENMMTTNAIGARPNLVSVGMVVDSDDPRPAFRAKITAPKMQGRVPFPKAVLFIADSFEVTIDVRPKLPPANGGANDFMTAKAPANDFMTARRPATSALANASSGGTGAAHPWWKSPGVLIPAATILVAATLATNILTCGLDAELDPAAGAAAAGMLKMAFAH